MRGGVITLYCRDCFVPILSGLAKTIFCHAEHGEASKCNLIFDAVMVRQTSFILSLTKYTNGFLGLFLFLISCGLLINIQRY